jgi:hypothetical protein
LKVLFDQGTPAPLRGALTGHTVFTAFEMGWAALDNGELLKAAEAAFEVLVTTDQNLRYQQNLSGRHLAILVLIASRELRGAGGWQVARPPGASAASRADHREGGRRPSGFSLPK